MVLHYISTCFLCQKLALSLRWCVSVAYRSYVYSRVGTRGEKFVLVDCDTTLSLALSNLHLAIAQDNGLNILSEFLRFPPSSYSSRIFWY
ncbi:hypothetical protein [Nostoc sp.]|uniref:hypothetical protein n=1 Tax=Nostoc sp. TaxID=1180 RepID=UPI002FFC064D